MTPYKHAQSSAQKWGGEPEDMSDYIGETTYEEFEKTLTDIVEKY